MATPQEDEKSVLPSFILACKEALAEEWEAEVIKAKIGCTCRITTFAFKRLVIIAITPDDPAVDVENLGVKYQMLDSETFSTANGGVLHLVDDEDAPHITAVEVVRKPIDHWPKAALYVACSTPLIDPEVLSRILNKSEDGVRFRCIDTDIMGSRHALALKRFEQHADESVRQISRPLDHLLRAAFLTTLPTTELDNDLSHSVCPSPEALNSSQLMAFHIAVRSRISICIGPPATGKTRMLAELILALHRKNPRDRIAVVAVTHVAVDELLKKVQSLCRTDKELKVITRFYSPGRTDGDIAYEIIGPGSIPAGHIEARRIELAKTKHPSQRKKYFEGLSLLKDEGGPVGKHPMKEEDALGVEETDLASGWGDSDWDDWRRLRHSLTDQVMNETSMLFCTSSSIQSRGIYSNRGMFETVWAAKTCIFDEAGCAKPVDIMQPLLMMGKTLERVVFCGDNKQLGPSLFSDVGKATFGKPTWFSALVKGAFPVTTLKRQYRSHDQLYAPTTSVLYENQVRSEHKTHEPRLFLRSMLAALPLQFSASGITYNIDSWRGFVDVPDGIAVTNDGGSSCNLLEAEAVSALVKAWVSTSFVTMKDIAVITGYRAQMKVLKELALRDEWTDVFITDGTEDRKPTDQPPTAAASPPLIRTIDSSQGAEYPIVILSLVRTHGDPGFMGELERANVSTSRAMEGVYFVGKYDFWVKDRYHDEDAGNEKGEGNINWMARVIRAHQAAHEVSRKGTFVRQGRSAKVKGHGIAANGVGKDEVANGHMPKVNLNQIQLKKESSERKDSHQEEDIAKDLAKLRM